MSGNYFDNLDDESKGLPLTGDEKFASPLADSVPHDIDRSVQIDAQVQLGGQMNPDPHAFGLIGVEIEITNLKVDFSNVDQRKSAVIYTRPDYKNDALTVEETSSGRINDRCCEFVNLEPKGSAKELLDSIAWMDIIGLELTAHRPVRPTRSFCFGFFTSCCQSREDDGGDGPVGRFSREQEQNNNPPLQRCTIIRHDKKIMDDADILPDKRYEIKALKTNIDGMVQISIGCHVCQLHRLLSLVLEPNKWKKLSEAWKITEMEKMGVAQESRGFDLLLLMYIDAACSIKKDNYRKSFFDVMPRTNMSTVFNSLSSETKKSLTDPENRNVLQLDYVKSILDRLGKNVVQAPVVEEKNPSLQNSVGGPDPAGQAKLRQRLANEANIMRRNRKMFQTKHDGQNHGKDLQPIDVETWLKTLPKSDMVRDNPGLSMGLGAMDKLCLVTKLPVFELRQWVAETAIPGQWCKLLNGKINDLVQRQLIRDDPIAPPEIPSQ